MTGMWCRPEISTFSEVQVRSGTSIRLSVSVVFSFAASAAMCVWIVRHSVSIWMPQCLAAVASASARSSARPVSVRDCPSGAVIVIDTEPTAGTRRSTSKSISSLASMTARASPRRS